VRMPVRYAQTMKAAVPRWRINTGASLKSSDVRHSFPAIRPVTGTSMGHGPGHLATAATSPSLVMTRSSW
jgi:hypothetical protein